MIDEINNCFSMTFDFLVKLVDRTPDDMWTLQPGGAVNHPAWVVGHLIHSCQAIGSEMGIQPWLPPEWGEMFGTSSTPVAARDQYPSKEKLLESLAVARRKLTERLMEIGESGLAEPLPDLQYRKIFPTVGHGVLHVLTAHAAVHVGQLTVWRRVVGLGPIHETFE